ncbi:hypothetical protein ACP4OV_027373 [Aristida adscensionis]
MTTAAAEDASAADGEELEPLFNYKRVQPAMAFRFDDSDLEKADIFKYCNKRAKVTAADKVEAGEKGAAGVEKKATVVDLDEEDWLLPPPKATARVHAEENSALRELRLKKQELAKIAESAQDMLQKTYQSAQQEIAAKETPVNIILDEEPEPEAEKSRETIVISIEDKDRQLIRVYKDDKFGKIFKAYAKKAKLNPLDLTFVFDGEKIDPAITPEDLGLEDDDMIEVLHKRQ